MNINEAVNNRTKSKLYVSLSARPGSTGTKFYTMLFDHYGIDAEYVACASTDIEYDLSLARLHCNGVSISMPFKQHLQPYVDEWAIPSTGIANTLLVNDNKFIAYNCDLLGLKHIIDSNIGSVVILGDGAMADNVKMICEGAKQYSRKLNNWNQRHQSCDMLINTTSVGMIEGECPIDEINSQIVIDCVIGNTKFIKMAKEKQLTAINGSDIYVSQFIHQFALYTGIDPDKNLVNKIKEKVFV